MESNIKSLVYSILSDITHKDLSLFADNSDDFENHIRKIFEILHKNDEGLVAKHDVILSLIAFLNYFNHFSYPYEDIDRDCKRWKKNDAWDYENYRKILVLTLSCRDDYLPILDNELER